MGSRFHGKGLTCAIMLTVGLVSTTALAQQKIELKASVFAPPANPMVVATEAWGKHLTDKSGGRLTVKVFAASQMGPPPRQFDLARTGVADVAIVPHFLTPGRFPLSELTNQPGILSGSGYANSLAISQIAHDTLASEHPGTRIMAVGVVTPTLIISKLAIKTPADLKGRRIRSAGAAQAGMLTAMGAVPALIQPGEMNDAISKGMIDGAGTAYSGIVSFQLFDVAKSITEGPFGSVTFALVMNAGVYNKLPADLKAIVDQSRATAAHLLGRALADDKNKGRQTSIAKGATILTFADDGTLKKVSDDLRNKAVDDAERKGIGAKAFLAKLQAALDQHKDKK